MILQEVYPVQHKQLIILLLPEAVAADIHMEQELVREDIENLT
jgi:hypothetical protein